MAGLLVLKALFFLKLAANILLFLPYLAWALLCRLIETGFVARTFLDPDNFFGVPVRKCPSCHTTLKWTPRLNARY